MYRQILLAFAVFLTSPILLFAHGAGEAIQKEHNGYLLSVGSADEFLYMGEAGRINFEIETPDGVAFEGWTGVWTRITSPSGELLFAGNIERGGDGLIAGMTFHFEESGTHEVILRFMNREKIVAESTFDLSVLGLRDGGINAPQSKDVFMFVIIFAVGILAGFVLCDLMTKKVKVKMG